MLCERGTPNIYIRLKAERANFIYIYASAFAIVEEAKREKHEHTCASHSFDFQPFGFSVLGSFGLDSKELLHRVCQRYHIHARVVEWEAHAQVHGRLSFVIMPRVANQFVGRRLASFSW